MKKILNFAYTDFINQSSAFTLAEVLITLAVIGIVAVLTIPNLIQNHNQKAWETAQSVFTKRLEVATRQMNTEEKLAGYDNTMDFINELKKYIKITRVCDSNDLSKCFESKILTADGQDIDLSEFEGNSKQFTKDNWGTETVGVQFANGVNALVAYNPNTDQQPFNNQFSATEASMAILYDVSGYKNPNTLGKDVNQNANVTDLGCRINPDLLDGICITKILSPDSGYSPITYDECVELKNNEQLGIESCYSGISDDYWGGAVKACGGIQKMPNEEDLIKLAQYLYNNKSINTNTHIGNLNLDMNKGKMFLSAYGNAGIINDGFNVWGVGYSGYNYYAYERHFMKNYTVMTTYLRNYSFLAVCINK